MTAWIVGASEVDSGTVLLWLTSGRLADISSTPASALRGYRDTGIDRSDYDAYPITLERVP